MKTKQVNETFSAAKISLAVSFLVLGLKTWAYLQTHSSAVMSDAIESVVNVLAAFIALFIIYYSQQPADEDHPYGHGKLEYFSAAFEGGMIFFAALMIVRESVHALTYGVHIQKISEGIIYSAVATVLNLTTGLYLLKKGKSHNSEALKASGAHLLSDCWTTLGAIFALGLVWWTDAKWIDPAVAIVVAVALAYSGVKIFMRSTNLLIDGLDREALENLTLALNTNRLQGIIDIHHVRSIKAGNFHHIDAHLVVPEFWDIKAAHDLSEDFEERVVKQYKYNGEFAFHLDPCKRNYCDVCSLKICHLRQRDFVAEKEFKVESLILGPMPTLSKDQDHV